jgi:hypothetical protein
MVELTQDNRKNPGIKRPYYPLPVELPETTRCVQFRIPDGDEYVEMLRTVLKSLTLWNNYARDETHRGKLAADLWRDVLLLPELEGCMNCEELQDCLAPLLADQLQQIQNMLDQSKYGTTERPGTKMTTGEKNTNLGGTTNPTCDLDIAWAQCLQVVEYGVALVTQALQIAESATNDVEMLQAIGQLPGLDEIGVDAVASYINLILEGVSDNYEAQVDETYIETAACALFCFARIDCQITPDMIYQVFLDRVLTHFENPGEIFGTINDLLAYLIDLDIDGTIVADVLHLLVFGGGVLANIFLGDVGTKSLQTLLRLAVDDASSDWEILCTECPELETWCHTFDFTLGDHGWEVVAAHGNYAAGIGFEDVGEVSMWIQRAGFNFNKINLVTAYLDGQDAGIQLFNPGDGTGAFSQIQGAHSDEPQNNVSGDSGFSVVESLGVRVALDGVAVWTGVLTGLEVCGFGEEPDWGE